MSLSTQIELAILATEVFNAGTITAPAMHRINQIINLKSGNTAGKANVVYSAQRTLSSTSEVLNLTNTLINASGTAGALTFTNVKAVIIQNTNLVAGQDLEWGPDSTNGWGTGGIVKAGTGRRVVPAGRTLTDMGLDVWYDPNGHPVVAATTDEIFVDAGGNEVIYNIMIIGTV